MHLLVQNQDMINNLKRYYRIVAVPLFQDNYSYIVQGTAQGKLVLVDPANPTVILAFLKDNFPLHQVSHVLYTHKHWDHAGGSLQLKESLSASNPAIELVIGQKDREHVQGATYSLKQNEELMIGNSRIKTQHVPCHTKGHTVYNFLPLSQQKQQAQSQHALKETIEGKVPKQFSSQSCLFTGDTLFVGGMGRFFEGNAEEMGSNVKNMYQRVDLDSHMYCGHQYALANLRWALRVENNNQKIREHLQILQKQFSQKGRVWSIPSSLRLQKQINLFIRAIMGNDFPLPFSSHPIEALRALRQMKNKNLTQFPLETSHL